jgi:hypothetical protein
MDLAGVYFSRYSSHPEYNGLIHNKPTGPQHGLDGDRAIELYTWYYTQAATAFEQPGLYTGTQDTDEYYAYSMYNISLVYVLGPVPEVDVMAKGPQGLLNVGDSFRADGGAAFLRSWHLAPCASRFSLAICSLATFPWPPPPSSP